jgi:hypothetical protein
MENAKVLLTDQEFIDTIGERTGLRLGTDYGFIMGLQNPFMNNSGGHQSASMKRGFVVWKIKDGSMAERDMVAGWQSESLEMIISFLKE